jgi:hypothetical protein
MDGQKKTLLERILDKVVHLLLHTVEVYKLKGYRKISEAFALVFTGLFVAAIFGGLLLFVSIGLALYLGKILGHWHYGFFIIGGIYGIMGIFLNLIGRRFIKNALHNYFLSAFFNVKGNF